MPILVKIDGLSGHGDATLAGYEGGDWFVADSFSFGVEQATPKSGKAGAVNVGVGQLADVSISKSMDGTSPLLAQLAVNGNSGGDAQIDVVQPGDGQLVVSLRYRLNRCFVTRWSTTADADDRPDEEVGLTFAKIAFTVAGTGPVFGWNRVKQKVWNGHGLDPLPVPPN